MTYPSVLLPGGGTPERFSALLKGTKGKGLNPQIRKSLPVRKIKSVYQNLQILEKSGLHKYQSSGTNAWPLTLTWMQLRFWWLMETSAFLSTLLPGWKELQIIRNCVKPGALYVTLNKILQTFKHPWLCRPVHTLFLPSRKSRDKAHKTPTQSQPCKRTKNPNAQFFYISCYNYQFRKFTNDSTSLALFSIHRPKW